MTENDKPLLNWTGESWLLEWWIGDDKFSVDIYESGEIVTLQQFKDRPTIVRTVLSDFFTDTRPKPADCEPKGTE